MLPVLLSYLLAIMAGVGIVIQQALNANLRTALNSAAWAGFANYVAGIIFMGVVALAMREPLPATALAARIPWWAWSGGMFGAMFIGLAIVLVPKLGTATFIALLVSGQMVASIIFDQFGWFGLTQRTIDLPRLIGVVLLIGGVVLIRR